MLEVTLKPARSAATVRAHRDQMPASESVLRLRIATGM